jgi:hypothetical protein
MFTCWPVGPAQQARRLRMAVYCRASPAAGSRPWRRRVPRPAVIQMRWARTPPATGNDENRHGHARFNGMHLPCRRFSPVLAYRELGYLPVQPGSTEVRPARECISFSGRAIAATHPPFARLMRSHVWPTRRQCPASIHRRDDRPITAHHTGGRRAWLERRSRATEAVGPPRVGLLGAIL